MVVCFWGFGFVATYKVLESGYTTWVLMSVRFGIAAAIFAVASRKQLRYAIRADIMGGLVCGIFLFAGFALQTMGMAMGATPSNNAFLTASNVIFIPFFSWIVFGNRPLPKVFASAALCLLGIGILSVDFSNLGHFAIGDLLTLIGAVAFAIHSVTMGYFSLRGNSIILNFLQMLMVTVLSTAVMFATGGTQGQKIIRPGFQWVLYLAIFSTAIAYMIQTSALKHLSPPRVGIITSTESIVGTFFSILFGYETLNLAMILGGSLVFLAIIIVEKPTKIRKGVK